MDHFSNQLSHYNEIYPLEYHEPDSDLWELEQARYEMMKKSIQTVLVELNRQVDSFVNTIWET